MRFSRILVPVSVVAILGISSFGCDYNRLKTYPIRGSVVFADGAPVKVGTVETKSVEHGVQATGAIERDGSFTLTTYTPNDGAVAGKHRCVVVQFIQVEEIPNYRPSTLGVVHAKHSTYSTSELAFQVEPNRTNDVKLVVQGVDPTSQTSKDHGHDPIPPETTDQKEQ